ncbi:MAG: Tn3 family transposase [Pseudoruegeria sp.]
MAGASSTHSFAQLAWLSNWHVENEAINRALAIVIEAQAQLPMAKFGWQGKRLPATGSSFRLHARARR